MRLEEPFIRIDILDATDVPESVRAAIGNEQLDPVDHSQLLFRERSTVRIGEGAAPPGLIRCWLIRLCVTDTDLIGQRLLGKESEHGFAFVENTVAVGNAEVELLDDHAAAGGNLGHGGAAGQHTVVRRHGSVLHGGAAQVAEGDIIRGGQSRTRIRGQPAARLQRRFQKDAKRHARLAQSGEEPGIGRQIILGFNHGAGGHLPRFAAYGGDAIHELERWPRQAGNLAFGVEHAVTVAESFGRVAVTVGHDLFFCVDGGFYPALII